MCNRRFIASGDVTSGTDFIPEIRPPPHVPPASHARLYYSRPMSTLHAVFMSYKKPHMHLPYLILFSVISLS